MEASRGRKPCGWVRHGCPSDPEQRPGEPPPRLDPRAAAGAALLLLQTQWRWRQVDGRGWPMWPSPSERSGGPTSPARPDVPAATSPLPTTSVCLVSEEAAATLMGTGTSLNPIPGCASVLGHHDEVPPAGHWLTEQTSRLWLLETRNPRSRCQRGCRGGGPSRLSQPLVPQRVSPCVCIPQSLPLSPRGLCRSVSVFPCLLLCRFFSPYQDTSHTG